MNEKIIEFSVSVENIGMRIDKFIVKQLPDLTRNAIQKLILNQKVTIMNKPVMKNYKVKNNDVIQICIPEPVAFEPKAENIPLDILYEDNDLLIVNKPKGMVVHPAPGNTAGTLVNALLYHCGSSLSTLNDIVRPGIVHRIDKDTSGLLIVAKNNYSHQILAEQIKAHSFTRIYEAVVCGRIKQDKGTINEPIGRHPVHRKKMAVTKENSKIAITHYEVIKRYKGFTHLRLRLETGRTHQIRVHMSYIGHPVAGDTVYGGITTGVASHLNGQCLHAKYISFVHPTTKKEVYFDSNLPNYFTDFLSRLTPED